MAYFFSSAIDVDIKLEGEELRKQVEIKGEKEKNISCPVYYDGDSVTGQVCLLCDNNSDLQLTALFQVTIRIRDGKKTTHEGIKVEFVGSIGLSSSMQQLEANESSHRTVLRPWTPP